MTTATTAGLNRFTETRVQLASFIVGIVFLLVGVLGFVPGITTNLGDLGAAGPDSDAHLLGIFQVSVLHNIVHLAFGVAGILLARAAGTARHFLVWGGAVYAVLWVYGLFVNHDSAANFVPLNDADNWLHFVLAVGMIALGLLLPKARTARSAV